MQAHGQLGPKENRNVLGSINLGLNPSVAKGSLKKKGNSSMLKTHACCCKSGKLHDFK